MLTLIAPTTDDLTSPEDARTSAFLGDNEPFAQIDGRNWM